MLKFLFTCLLVFFPLYNILADAPLTTNTTQPQNQLKNSELLTPYKANYEVTWKSGWFPITVKASRTLKKAEEFDWTLSFEAYSSIADLSEISTFNLIENKIQPQKYRYKTTGFLTKSKRSQEFNWEDKKLWIPNKDMWAEYELPDNLQDNMSYQEQIRIELKEGKKVFEYPIAYKNRLKHYYLEVVGESQLTTKQGKVTAIEVKQTHLKSKKESTRLWYAKDYEYILLKLEKIKSNGNKNTILLKDALINNKTLLGF